MKKKSLFTLVVFALLFMVPAYGQIPRIGGLGASGSSDSIAGLVQTYKGLYRSAGLAEAAMLRALGVHQEAQSLESLLAGLETTSSKDLADAIKKAPSRVSLITAQLSSDLQLTEAQKVELVSAFGQYVLLIPELKKFVNQASSVKRPGSRDIMALNDFQLMATVPDFLQMIVGGVPAIAVSLKELGIDLTDSVNAILTGL